MEKELEPRHKYYQKPAAVLVFRHTEIAVLMAPRGHIWSLSGVQTGNQERGEARDRSQESCSKEMHMQPLEDYTIGKWAGMLGGAPKSRSCY